MSVQSGARKKALGLFGLAVVVAAVGTGAWWYTTQRGFVTTDDAYVSGNVVSVTPQVIGDVASIHAEETRHVTAGSLLVQLDQTDAQLALQRSQTQLAQTVRQMAQLQAQLHQLDANIDLRRAELARLQGDQARREVLGLTNAVGKEEVLHARSGVDTGKAALQVAIQERQTLQARLRDTPLAELPEVRFAAEQVREAWLAVQRTRIVSPVDGVVARRAVQVGAHVTPGTPLMAVVSLDHVWVDANFKEIQLDNVRINQPVELTADLYGEKVVYHGKVGGLSAGTGTVFSLLPAQNATGNWLKVVQRLPVRVELDPAEIAQHPLRLGLSMQVRIDVRDTSGQHLVQADATPIAQTKVLKQDLQAVDQQIAKIIADNSKAG